MVRNGRGTEGDEGGGGLLMEFFVSMMTPGPVGPRMVQLLFGCLGALALLLVVLIWWHAGSDVATHAIVLLLLTFLLAASLLWFASPHPRAPLVRSVEWPTHRVLSELRLKEQQEENRSSRDTKDDVNVGRDKKRKQK